MNKPANNFKIDKTEVRLKLYANLLYWIEKENNKKNISWKLLESIKSS